MASTIKLDLRFRRTTPDGKPNLNWAIDRYFVRICDDHNVNPSNRELYLSDYNNSICPFIKPGLAISDYTEADIRELFDVVTRMNPITKETFERRHRHLIVDPYQYYRREKENMDNPDWGAFYKYDYKGQDIETSLSLVTRTFTNDEVKSIKNELLDKIQTISGEKMGIAICEYLGARLNESAGMSFGDFVPMKYYPQEYIARIGIITTKLHSKDRKLGGKTWNAPRFVPVQDLLLEAILKRMKYIETQIDFPYMDGNRIINSVLELPVACHKNNYTECCGADDISKAARTMFQNELKFSEQRMAGISELMFRDPLLYVEDKDPTCYTCRRDYATELSIAFDGHPDGLSYIQYLMGHSIEDKRYRRNDFTDEYYLHEMKLLIEQSHRINRV